MSLAYNNGYQIAYHAIGDGANHQVLNTYERLLKENPVEMEELETYLRKVRADFRKRDLS